MKLCKGIIMPIKPQDKADATCCRAVQGLLEKAIAEFEVAKNETTDSSKEEYVIIREQIKSSLQNAYNLATQAVQVLDPPIMPTLSPVADNQTIVNKSELEELQAAKAELDALKAKQK